MIMRDDVKEMIVGGCRALMPQNGASDAARIVDSLATDLKLGRFVDEIPSVATTNVPATRANVVSLASRN